MDIQGVARKAFVCLLAAGLSACCYGQSNLSVQAATINFGTATYQAPGTITSAVPFVVQGSGSVTFTAGSSIVLQPGFEAVAGSAAITFLANINGSVSSVTISTGGYTPTVTITNTSRSSANFEVGDNFLLQITGFPDQTVSDQSYQNSVAQGLTTYSATSSAGTFQLTGVMTTSAVGNWTEDWAVGGVAAPTLSFSVSTNDLPNSPTKEYIYLNGKVVAIENPK